MTNMTDATSSTIDYLVRTLQLNPALQGEEIIRSRMEMLGLTNLTPVKDAAVSDGVRDRRECMDLLKDARASFWTLSTEELTSRLAELEQMDFPDIRLAARRLETVLQHREEVSRIFEGSDRVYVDSIKRVLTASRGEANAAKQDALATFNGWSSRRKGRRALKRLKGELPEVYQLDRDWLEMAYSHSRTSWLKGDIPIPRLLGRMTKRTRSVIWLSLLIAIALSPVLPAASAVYIWCWALFGLVRIVWRLVVRSR
jgi:hypothetical protein